MFSSARHEWGARRARAAVAIFVSSCVLLGCVSPTDPLGRQDSLEEAQQRYTELIRWGEVERAAMYVDPELVDDFLTLAGTMANLRITDFDTGEIEFGDDTAVARVVYRGYSISEFVERAARETQDWYREGGLTDPWRVRPQLQHVVAVLRGEVAGAPGN